MRLRLVAVAAVREAPHAVRRVMFQVGILTLLVVAQRLKVRAAAAAAHVMDQLTALMAGQAAAQLLLLLQEEPAELPFLRDKDSLVGMLQQMAILI